MENIKKKQVEKYHKTAVGKKEEIECNPYAIFHQALENCKPVVGLASIQKGGKYYQVSHEAHQRTLILLPRCMNIQMSNRTVFVFNPN